MLSDEEEGPAISAESDDGCDVNAGDQAVTNAPRRTRRSRKLIAGDYHDDDDSLSENTPINVDDDHPNITATTTVCSSPTDADSTYEVVAEKVSR
jgi:hypothetical protein